MTDQNIAEVAGIAAKLTGQAQERLHLGTWNISAWAENYLKHGIVEREPPHFVHLTPLGLAVRAHLLSENQQ